SGSSILAHPQQKGNPLLKELTHQRWEHAEIAPDYHIAQSTCALFLQLKYHRLHPEYIHQRIKAISGMYSHRLLILQHDVDASSSEPAIRELTKISIVNNLTLLLAWTPQEAAQWLEKYKMCEFKGAELIRGRPKETQRERMSDVLTQPTGVNKADATALMAKFGSIRNISQATADDLSDIPGMGEIKIKRLREAF
ncbi:DNA repair protein rad10, partial [Microstroma glucosiphilum]